jgi:hypothetical protein
VRPVAPHIGVVGERTCSARTAALARRVGQAVARAGAVLPVRVEAASKRFSRVLRAEYLTFFGQI